MHHYPFHIGDYRSGCINFSKLERWIYRDLLDVCYDTERPLPLDHDAIYRAVGARTEEEKQAVEAVLQDKFERTDDGYINKRVQEEIDKYHEKADRARAANKKRWETTAEQHQNDDDLKSDLISEAVRIPTKNQEPRTINQEKPKTSANGQSRGDANAPPTASPPPIARGTRLKHDWQLPPEWAAFAFTERPQWSSENLRRVADTFRDHFVSSSGAKGVKSDWFAAWRNWVRREGGGSAFGRGPPEATGRAARMDNYAAQAAIARARMGVNGGFDDDGIIIDGTAKRAP